MKEYMYPTQAYKDKSDWQQNLVAEWKRQKTPYLSFAFFRFHVTTLPDEPFWLFMYNTMSRSDHPILKGKIINRFHVIDWDTVQYQQPDIYIRQPVKSTAKIWFKCDKFEEIRKKNNEYVSYHDFRHADNKNLGSALRSSIPPVVCKVKFDVIQEYHFE